MNSVVDRTSRKQRVDKELDCLHDAMREGVPPFQSMRGSQMNVEKISIAIVAFCVAATNSRGAHADSFEEYVVDSAAELIPGMLELVVHLRPGSTELTPVTRILLLDGATSTNNRSGIELGNGATVNLGENDYQDALDHIDAGDIVSYLSKPIPSRRPPPRSSIANFNFPIDYPE